MYIYIHVHSADQSYSANVVYKTSSSRHIDKHMPLTV